LGAPQFDLVGVSYGTRMAQQYATAYPGAVRSVILDSVVPNELVLGSETALNLDAALKARFAVCTHTPACAQRFGDPYAAMVRLRDALRARPQTVTVRDPVTYAGEEAEARAADLAVTARLFAYSASTAALLPLTIDEALHGHYAPLLGQRRLITQSLNDQLTDGMGLSVACADDADLLQPRPEDDSLLLGQSLVQYLRVACEVWPKGSRTAGFHEPWRSDAPVLVVAGEFDPITPRRYGDAVVKHLSRGRLLVLKGQGHGVLGTGCLPRLAGEFVESLDARALDASCLDMLGDVPAFLGYSGAAP
jgi:pimeloyl-ACP methyl ester carboxylesterase